MITDQDLQNRFTYHKPGLSQQQLYVTLRAMAYELGQFIIDNVPDGREQALAVTKLEEVVFWSNAGIARGK